MFKLESILKKSEIEKIPAELVTAINEAIAVEFKAKFDIMMESINTRFDTYVNNTITESVSNNLTEKVNQKLLSTVQTIVNVLESAGLPVTEKASELAEQLKLADKNLMNAHEEREDIKKQMDEANKEKFIYSRLQGLRPEVVAAAIEHFKDKDILEVKEEIADFVEQNFDNIVPNFDTEFSDVLSSNAMDKVQGALDEIDAKNSDIDFERSVKFEGAEEFEKLGRGLAPMMARGKGMSPNISKESLDATDGILMESMGDVQVEGTGFTDDAKEALDKISDFSSLGYGMSFKKPRKK